MASGGALPGSVRGDDSDKRPSSGGAGQDTPGSSLKVSESQIRKEHKSLPQPAWESVPQEMRAAWIAAQREFKKAVTRRKGQDGHRVFDYSNYNDVVEAVAESLHESGLGYTHPTMEQNGLQYVGTTLISQHGCVTGWFVRAVPERAGMKAYGAALSYARRYSLKTCVGTPDASEDDIEQDKPEAKPTGIGISGKPDDDISDTLELLDAASHKGVEWFRKEFMKLTVETRKRINKDYKESVKRWQAVAERADSDANDPEAPPW